MSDHAALREEWPLIVRCCDGDETAWRILLERHTPRLLLAARGLLRRYHLPANLEEDLVLDVWLALVEGDKKRLLHYDPIRAGFECYAESIARQLAVLCWRKLAQGSLREVPLGQRDPMGDPGLEALASAQLAELVAAVSPQEGRLLQLCLGEPPPAQEPPLSKGNARQLKHRLQRKWHKYMQ